jgi:23S rRNA (cytidine1920-2'-O)/16S rRNA (cytidine1409-2'-O)-methyltransferase
VRRGLARSREQARQLVAAGRVTVSGQVANKPATMVDAAAPVVVGDDVHDPGYASRGAWKLAGALERLGGPVIAGRSCLDVGASTGGFTDVLLREGAREVTCVDVGYGLLDWRLRTDDRVTVRDRLNARLMQPNDLPYRPDVIVADLSFISLRLVLPALVACAAEGADLLPMVKPQFEVGRDMVGSGGVVRDPAQRADAVRRIAQAAYDLGWGTRGVAASPLPGPSGNVEFFLWLRSDAEPPDPERIGAIVEAGHEG